MESQPLPLAVALWYFSREQKATVYSPVQSMIIRTIFFLEGHCHEHGKTWVACAFGHQACRAGYSVLYWRLPRLLQELPTAKGDGRYAKVMAALAKPDLLILDDWGLTQFEEESRHDVLELLEERHGRRATIVTSQLPVEHWHAAIGEPTLADAILDRLVHNAYKLALQGDSLRKRLTPSVTAESKD